MKIFLVWALLVGMSFAVDQDSASSTPNADRSKPEQATSIQGADSPEDMQKLLAETARSYREAKSFRIEREEVVTTESELMTLSSKSLFDVIAAPENRYRIVQK